MFIKYLSFFALCIILSSCIGTEGEIELKGKTIDESTNEVIPFRKIVVEAILFYNQDDKKRISIGQFMSDSLGSFSFKLKKVKNAYNYNFHFVGDSCYAPTVKSLGIMEMADNSKFISFYLLKLTKLTIKVTKSSRTLHESILYLSWKSDGVEGKTLYQYKVSNLGVSPEFDFKWSGSNVNSKIETRVLADKPTIINWEIWNGRKKHEIVDTIDCKRDITNFVNFTY